MMNQNSRESQSRSALAFTATEPTLPAQEGVREWCEGLPLVGTRALTIAERDELQFMDTTARGGATGWGCATLIVFFVGLGVGALVEETHAFLMLLTMIGAPIPTLFIAMRAWNASQSARLSLAANTVSLYDQGRLHREDAPQEGIVQEVRVEIQRALHPEETLISLGVLTGGRTLWAVNGRRATSTAPFQARTRQQHTPPTLWPFLRRKVLPRRTSPSRPTTAIEQRALSNRERDELYAMSEQWKPLWPLMTLCGLTFGALLTGVLQALFAATLTSLTPLFYGALALTGWPFLRWVALVRRCLRLRRDYHQGTVEVEHCFYPPQETASTAHLWPPGTETIEVLPASGRVWTHDGQVATWRAASGEL